ncbi:MAG: AmmeMemoRadiSam system protein A [Bacteroidales bacterium]|nr:AmmeMemoRadiSam system protein A [Bacteroidales bacterium]MCF8403873.1 AmmeMemoRadiSam system protein A [Bacteroidales bacterium]
MDTENIFIPASPHAHLAYESIRSYLLKGNTNNLNITNLPPEFYDLRRACFVSLHLKDGSLRGCIGTLEPVEKNLYDEIVRNAISAACNDRRFSPLKKSELSKIEISVDVLSLPEKISDINDLDPSIYGIIISDNNYRRGVLLPAIDEIDTIEKQISIVMRKAGLSNAKWEDLSVFRFTTTRYH